MNRPRYAVGIDPGTKTGLAVYDRHRKELINVITTDFWVVYNKFYASEPEDYDIFIEVPRTKRNWHKSKNMVTSANVGGIYREAVLLAEGIERLGFNVTKSHPKGKVDAHMLKRLTGYTKRTNEHTRDAIMLCFGK